MLGKKVDQTSLNCLIPEAEDMETETKRILDQYFNQIMKVIPKFKSISKFELFYLGQFHAICPNYKIQGIFAHINNINNLVNEDLIDEETKIDFLLKILNRKISAEKSKHVKILYIPDDPKSPVYVGD
mmetsp:Transcript_20426/g.17755  ORF Transcript_20426/g.17755 Transcript_20426/m.17755 type:complete len:128 (-) Transcript_20426:722-1105(-)